MSAASNDPVSALKSKNEGDTKFAGFEHPTANFIYCPNQFFDVCLSESSRNVVRIVAYLLDRTLGWLDSNGNPIQQVVSLSYSELITKAGVSRSCIRAAIDEAVAGGYIVCLQPGERRSQGKSGQTA